MSYVDFDIENILKEKTINEKIIDKREERIENFENNRMRNNNFTPLSSFNNSYNPSMFIPLSIINFEIPNS